jgi:hypothetical protein
VLAKEAQDLAKPYDVEFFSGSLRSRTRTGKFTLYTVKKMEFRWRKSKKRNERDIERALGSRGTFLSRAGWATHITIEKYFLMNF